MRFARDGVVASFAIFAFTIAACKGGPGSVDQGGDNGSQYDGVSQDTGDDGVASDTSPSASSSSSSSGVAASSASSTSSSSSGAVTPPPPLSANDYAQSCANDNECQAIYQGPACQPCPCPNAAIATGDYVRYLDDSSTRKAMCPASPGAGACAACPASPVHCNKGSNKCAFGAAH